MRKQLIGAVGLMILTVSSSSSSAAIIKFSTLMDGATESPAVITPGTGQAMLTYDDVAHTLAIEASFQDLTGVTTVAHIHAPTADAFSGTVGVAVTPGTLPGFPVGVTSGTYSTTLDLTNTATYTGGFLATGGGTAAGAEALLVLSLIDGKAYFNVHTQFRTGGEIRGFFPEPGTAAVAAVGLPVLLRRRKPAV